MMHSDNALVRISSASIGVHLRQIPFSAQFGVVSEYRIAATETRFLGARCQALEPLLHLE